MSLTTIDSNPSPESRSPLDDNRLLTALSKVERLRWELDAAACDLRVAVEDAIQDGVPPADIAATIDRGHHGAQPLCSR